ncbi:MAG: DUF6056 family protein, partial [Acidobacteria bacterium]|nr:DUF6056 family protein [Acidobacteriota bacterium]
ATLILFATLSETPSVFESLYWQTGMLTYLVPLVVLTFYIGFLKKCCDSPARGRRRDALCLASSFLITFVAGGFSETYVVLQSCLLSVALACAVGLPWLKRTKLWPLLVAGLLGSVAALAMVAASPGNKVRQAALPSPQGFFNSVMSSFAYAFDFITGEHVYLVPPVLRWTTVLLVALLAFRLPLDEAAPAARALKSGNLKWALVLSPLAAYLLIVACIFPAMYVAASHPPPRSLVNAQFVLVCFMVGWGYLVGLALKRIAAKNATPHDTPLFNALSVAALVLLALIPLAATRATLLRVPKARALAALWEKQHAELRAAESRGVKSMTVSTVYYLEGTDLLKRDPQWYVNECVAAYYGMDSLTAVPDPEGIRIMVEETGR